MALIDKLLCWLGLHNHQYLGLGTVKIILYASVLEALPAKIFRCRRCGERRVELVEQWPDAG